LNNIDKQLAKWDTISAGCNHIQIRKEIAEPIEQDIILKLVLKKTIKTVVRAMLDFV
jgi:hypothetical protein